MEKHITSIRNQIMKNEEDVVILSLSDVLNKEIKAAGRGAYPVLFVMLKLVSPGEEVMNPEEIQEAIEAINTILKAKLRDTDMIFLYSTDTSIILLPFSDSKASQTIMDKIENIIETNTIIKKMNKGFISKMSWAVYPADGKVKDKILENLISRLS